MLRAEVETLLLEKIHVDRGKRSDALREFARRCPQEVLELLSGRAVNGFDASRVAEPILGGNVQAEGPKARAGGSMIQSLRGFGRILALRLRRIRRTLNVIPSSRLRLRLPALGRSLEGAAV